MTEPWATAHVDAELNYGDIDDELVRRLERSTELAAIAVQKHFDRMEQRARKTFRRITTAYRDTTRDMVRDTQQAVTAINQELDRINGPGSLNISVSVDTSRAWDELRDMHRDMQAWLNANPLTVRVRVDQQGGALGGRRGIAGSLAGIASGAKRATSSLGGLASGLATFGKLTALAGAATVAIGGMMPAVAALGAALGVTAVAGAGAFATGILGVIGSVAALKTAFSGVGDALKNAFDPEKAEEFNEALAKLTPQARSAVLAMQGLGKEYAQVVKAPVQDTFFRNLAPEIQRTQQLLPTLRNSLVGIAQGFNDGARSALGFVNSASGVSMLTTMLGNASSIGATMGRTLGNLVPGLLAIGTGASQAFTPLTTGIAGAAQRLSDFLVKAQQSGQIKSFFDSAIVVAQQLGGVLVQLGGILGGVFRAAGAAAGGNFLGGITTTLSTINTWVNGPGSQALTTFFQSMQAGLGAVLPIILQLAGIIGTTVAPAISGLLQQIGPSIQTLVTGLGQGLAAIAPAMPALGGAISSIATALAPVMPILGQLIAQFLQLAGPIVGALATALGPILQSLGTALVGVFQALMPAVQPITQVFQALSPVIAQIATTLGQVLASAISAIVPIFTTLAGVVAQLLPAIQPLIPIIGDLLVQAIQLVAPIIQQMATAWAEMVVSLLPLIPPLMQIVQALLPPLIQIIGALLPLITLAALTFAQLVPAIAPLIGVLAQVLAFVARLVGAFLGFVATVLGAVVGFVTGVVGKFTELITTVVSAVTGFVARVVGFFVEMGGQLLSAAQTAWTTVSGAFREGVSSAINFVREMPGKALGALANIGTILFDAGKRLIQGFIDGIKSMVQGAKDAVGNVINGVKSIIPGLGNAEGGPVPGNFAGGPVARMATGGRAPSGSATTAIKPGGFIVNAAAAEANKGLLRTLAPGGRFITGPGTPTSDSIIGMDGGRPVTAVSRDEYYVPPEQAQGILPTLFAINAGGLQRMVDGGALKKVAAGITKSGYVWGGWGNGWNTDCSGAASSLVNMATGKADAPGKGERSATGGFATWLRKMGLKTGMGKPGDLSIGWSDTHAASTLPDGTNVEHTGPEGAPGKFGGDAQGADSGDLPNKAHLPMGDANLGGGLSGTNGNGLGSGGLGGTSTGSTSYGNAGGSSSVSSAKDAEKAGLVPVWVENWPSNLGGSSSLSTTTTPSGDLSTTTTPAPGPQKDLRKGATKAEMVAEVVRQGKEKGMSDADIESAVAALLAESDGKNYANSNVAGSTARPHDAVGSDGKSLGVMQQQSGMGWGTDEQLMDPRYAIGKYYDTLKKVEGRDQMSVEQRAQAVQRSAFSDGSNYAAKRAEARELISKAGQVPVTTNGNVPVEIQNTTTTPPPDQPGTPGTTPPPATTTTQPQPPSIGGSPVSSMAGGHVKSATATGIDKFIKDQPGLLGSYKNPEGDKSIGTRAGSVAESFVSGQLGSALGIFGLDVQPPALDAVGQYMQDNPRNSGEQPTTKKDLVDLAQALMEGAPISVVINGNADGQEVADRLARERRRRMRRYVK